MLNLSDSLSSSEYGKARCVAALSGTVVFFENIYIRDQCLNYISVFDPPGLWRMIVGVITHYNYCG